MLENRRFDKIENLIKLWISLINETMNLIERIDKYEVLIKPWFILINNIGNLIKKLISLRVNWALK